MFNLGHILVSSCCVLSILASKAPNDSQHPDEPCVNTPQTRQCWSKDFDIHTDYEENVPPGRLREVRSLVTGWNHEAALTYFAV
jgi:hypothetical protein